MLQFSIKNETLCYTVIMIKITALFEMLMETKYHYGLTKDKINDNLF